jgi:hypothetical protein
VTEHELPPCPSSGLTRRQWGLIFLADQIRQEPPDRLQFSHTVLCQVGLPRKHTPQRRYERANGNRSLLVEAGSLWNGQQWTEQPLPYGAIPRLVLVHISTEAVRTRSRVIDVGDSMREFLLRLGLQPTGGARGGYTALRKQMQALAACRMTLGMTDGARVTTIDAKPIKRFDAWLFHGHPHTNHDMNQDGSQSAGGVEALGPGARHLHVARPPAAAGG